MGVLVLRKQEKRSLELNKMMSLFTQYNVVSNLYDFLLLVKHKSRNFE